MILQALYDYYQRKASDPESKIAPLGMEWKEIPYLIIIDKEGKFVRIEDQSAGSEKALKVKRFLVPQAKGRSGSGSWQVSFDFWDHYGYVLGTPKTSVYKNDDPQEIEKAIMDAQKQHSTFRKIVTDICNKYPNNKEFKAVSAFYEAEENTDLIKQDTLWKELIKKDRTYISFKLIGKDDPVSEHKDLQPKEQEPITKDDTMGICLITGEKASIRDIHTKLMIPGEKTGAKIVGFQRNSGYNSYGKEQGYNAPISKKAESAYSTALKELMHKDSPNNYRIGNTQFLFWAQQSCEFEGDFVSYFSAPPKDNPDRNVEAIEKLMAAPRTGKLSEEEQTQFYILGLSPNTARISVRSWKTGKIKDFADHIRQHFSDLEIEQGINSKTYFSLFNLLTQISFGYKMDNLPPNIVGDMMRAILDGTPYPTTLQLHCLNRIKADGSISGIRAAILKAYLTRKQRFTNNINTTITMALDTENTDQAYLCGRLFATLEKIQEESSSGLNATVKRFYPAASTTPITVFPRLLALKNHHIAKLSPGNAINKEKLIGEIVDKIKISGYPKYLSLDGQSLFSIGYYHQRQAFYTKKENNNENE